MELSIANKILHIEQNLLLRQLWYKAKVSYSTVQMMQFFTFIHMTLTAVDIFLHLLGFPKCVKHVSSFR